MAVVLGAVVLAAALAGTSIDGSASHHTGSERSGSTPTSAPFSGAVGKVVYQSDFKASDGWRTGAVSPSVFASITKSGYLITASGAGHFLLPTPYVNAATGVSVTTSVTFYPETSLSFGAACQSNPEGNGTSLTALSSLSPTGGSFVYQFVVHPDGDWYLEKGDLPTQQITIVQEGTSSALHGRASIELLCNSDRPVGNDTKTVLLGYINGIPAVYDAELQAGLPPGGWTPVLLVGSAGPPVSATFTSMSVRVVPPGAT
ncbi:MAG TPA: hypothetical protein VFH58_07345 [Acidimicrobiales bacterium]|nr:hypothetical protein [Acidimicrobiales bacterium]